MMSSTPQKVVGHIAWPPTIGTTLLWDTGSGACRNVELHTVLEHGQLPSFQVEGAPLTEPRAHSYRPSGERCRAPVFPAQTLASVQASTGMLFSMAAILLGNNDHRVVSSMTGELVWFFSHKQTEPAASLVYPVLFGYACDALSQREHLTIIPALQICDPLQRHIDLVLHTAIAARSRAEQLYVKALADALVVHFLQRYAASQPRPQKLTGGLTSHKLQGTLVYIQTHLPQKLSLHTLAAVAQMSPTHFAHLFKHTTGLAPHRYVTLCRIEHAKRLLGETTMPLIDIGLEVGFSDQSHFTALFRKHVSMTPKTYRNATAQV